MKNSMLVVMTVVTLTLGIIGGVGGHILYLNHSIVPNATEDLGIHEVNAEKNELGVEYFAFSLNDKTEIALCADISILKQSAGAQSTLAHIVRVPNYEGTMVYLTVK